MAQTTTKSSIASTSNTLIARLRSKRRLGEDAKMVTDEAPTRVRSSGIIADHFRGHGHHSRPNMSITFSGACGVLRTLELRMASKAANQWVDALQVIKQLRRWRVKFDKLLFDF